MASHYSIKSLQIVKRLSVCIKDDERRQSNDEDHPKIGTNGGCRGRTHWVCKNDNEARTNEQVKI